MKVLSQLTKLSIMKALSSFESVSRSLGQNIWYCVKGLITMNTHVKYESPSEMRNYDLERQTK